MNVSQTASRNHKGRKMGAGIINSPSYLKRAWVSKVECGYSWRPQLAYICSTPFDLSAAVAFPDAGKFPFPPDWSRWSQELKCCLDKTANEKREISYRMVKKWRFPEQLFLHAHERIWGLHQIYTRTAFIVYGKLLNSNEAFANICSLAKSISRKNHIKIRMLPFRVFLRFQCIFFWQVLYYIILYTKTMHLINTLQFKYIIFCIK